MTHITLREWCLNRGISYGAGRRLAAAGRIGAIKAGQCWLILADTPRPEKIKPGRKPDYSQVKG